MQIACPHCQQLIEHSGAPPKFCSNCGEPLTEAKTELADAETLIGPAALPFDVSETEELKTLGPYRLGRELGRGGMGVVYEAEHADSGRRLALKVLSPNIPRNSETTERFLREGRLAAALSHPRSTFIYEAGEADGQLYIAMELVPGRTLARLIEEEGPLPVNRAVDYVLDVIEGLSAAHDSGVIHRDVKPSNCFLSDANRVKVGDFGLSKSLVTDAGLTRTGTFLGTPQYAAPEQVKGSEVDPRTDVYAVGGTLFFLLTGRGPFTGDAAAVIAQIASDAPPRLRDFRSDVPEELNRIVARAMEKKPEARFATMSELGNALRPFASGGVPIGDVGRRLAAYFLDYMVIGFCLAFVVMATVVGLMLTGNLALQNQPLWFEVGATLLTIGGLTLYFAICEGRWGCALGKRLMGLRVVNMQGEPPGFPRALIRALVIPGAASVPSVVLPLVSRPSAEAYGAQGPMPWITSLASWGLILLFLSTMRSRNGYRGLHEFASGTRVVRPRVESAAVLLQNCPMIAPLKTSASESMIGTYRITGRIGVSGSATILKSMDASLHRPVWIRIGPASGEAVSRERIAVSRPARPFWLQGGEVDGQRWDAFEAVRGAPVPVVVRHEHASGRLPWEKGRLLLLELSEELEAAAEDGTLPTQLTLEQVWAEPNGRIKLLDAPVRTSAGTSGSDDPCSDPCEPPAAAVRLLREMTALCSGDAARAVHVQEFIDELERRPEDASTLEWAARRLREVSHRQGRLKWDDRLGILAASSGTEQSLYLLWAMLIGGLCALIDAIPLPWRAALAVLLAAALPVLLGYWLRGGPVFRITGTVVRHQNAPASRLRCGWRSLLAWSLSMIGWSLLGMMQTPGSESGFPMTGNREEALFYMAVSMVWSFAYLLFILGALCTLIRPSRGIQDYLAGTSLVPR